VINLKSVPGRTVCSHSCYQCRRLQGTVRKKGTGVSLQTWF